MIGSRRRVVALVAGVGCSLVLVGQGAVATTPTSARIIASESRSQDQFGFSLDSDGPLSIVGAPGHDRVDGARDAGAAYVYDIDRSQTDHDELVPPDPVAGEAFGTAVAISGDLAVVGAPLAGTGRVVVFGRDADGWTPRAVLTPPRSTAGQRYGSSVDIDGDTVAVSASRKTSPDEVENDTYLYQSPDPGGSRWNLQLTFVSTPSVDAFYRFNDLVSLDGDTVAIGEPYLGDDARGQGAVEILTRSGTTWRQTAIVDSPSSEQGSNFGGSVELDGDTLIAGAPHASVRRFKQSGIAAVFERVDDTWTLRSTLIPPRSQDDQVCGASVDLAGDSALVGCPYRDEGAGPDVGRVFGYARTADGWELDRRQRAPMTTAHQLFGRSVAVADHQVLFGSIFSRRRSGVPTGAIFVRAP